MVKLSPLTFFFTFSFLLCWMFFVFLPLWSQPSLFFLSLSLLFLFFPFFPFFPSFMRHVSIYEDRLWLPLSTVQYNSAICYFDKVLLYWPDCYKPKCTFYIIVYRTTSTPTWIIELVAVHFLLVDVKNYIVPLSAKQLSYSRPLCEFSYMWLSTAGLLFNFILSTEQHFLSDLMLVWIPFQLNLHLVGFMPLSVCGASSCNSCMSYILKLNGRSASKVFLLPKLEPSFVDTLCFS